MILQAFITGSGRRIGRAMAEFLASHGYDVALHYNRSVDEVNELALLLRLKYPGRLFPVICHDLNNWKEAGKVFDLLPEQFNQISVLVNNASIYQPSTLTSATPEMIEQNFAVHCFAPMMLMQAFNRLFCKGLIVSVLDTKVNGNEFAFAPYLLSKKSLAELTKMAALEWAPRIRVNAILPGPVLPAVGADESRFEKVVSQTPLQEVVAMVEIVQTLHFFIQNKHITGQMINVDSGSHLQ